MKKKKNIELALGLAKRIRHLRKLRKMSQEELAFKAESERAYIGKIERGECSPSLELIYRISRAFNMDLPTLLCFDKLE